jgi:hypothetical protein
VKTFIAASPSIETRTCATHPDHGADRPGECDTEGAWEERNERVAPPAVPVGGGALEDDGQIRRCFISFLEGSGR